MRIVAVMDDRFVYMYGRHAVLEALNRRPDVVVELFLRDDIGDIPKEILATMRKPTRFHGDKVPPVIERSAVHQGYIAKVDTEKLVVSFADFCSALTVTPDTALVVLGELQDPHNVGAVIRSAAAFGAAAVLLPKHRQAGVTGTVLKVSAGMAFAIPLVEVPNVNRALEDLKERGFFVYGLDGAGETNVSEEDFRKPSVLVLGNEGTGVREKTAEHCDIMLKIPMHPRCESLNASVSAALVLHAWSLRHTKALDA